MERGTDGGNEERRRQLVLIEKAQYARQTIDCAIFAARENFVVQNACREARGCVVDVEGERHGDARTAGPRLRLETTPCADVKHLPAQLVDCQLGSWQRVLWRRLRAQIPSQSDYDRNSNGQKTDFSSHMPSHRAAVVAIASAERNVRAAKVSVPLVHPPVGNVGAPTTNKFE